MRPLQYSPNSPLLETLSHEETALPWWMPRIAADILSVLLASIGTFAMVWMVAMLTALLMLRA